MALSPAWLMRPELHLGRVRVPTTVAVFVRKPGQIVLVDAGYSRAELAQPFRELGVSGVLLTTTEESVSVAEQMEANGLNPSDVTTIVATHLHMDHIGGYVDFPNAEIIAPVAEFAHGQRASQLAGYRHVKGILRSGRARPLIWRGEACEGFPAHCDLFDDGQVVLFDAQGHTPGSVVVWLRDAASGENTLMVGDAAYTREEYRSHRQSWLGRFIGWRDEYIRATWGRLQAFELAHPEARIVPSHDHAAWCEVSCRLVRGL